MTVQDRPCWFIWPARRPLVDGGGRSYTNMYETKNETNRRPVTYGKRLRSDHLTFRLRAGSRTSASFGVSRLRGWATE
jgi:hypothetical protein